MKTKKNYNELKGKDLKDIISNVDNKWEFLAAIWICRNKETKNTIIISLLIIVITFITKPEVPSCLENWIGSIFKGLFKLIF